MELRVFTEEDWEAWRVLRRQALTEAPEAFYSTIAEWTGEGDVEERWRQRLRSVPHNLVAYVGAEPAGMVSATDPIDGAMALLSLWVAPAARGRGVGDELVRAVLRHAEGCGAARVTLDVREGNEHALALYARHGFVDAGPAPNLKPEDPPERRMVRVL